MGAALPRDPVVGMPVVVKAVGPYVVYKRAGTRRGVKRYTVYRRMGVLEVPVMQFHNLRQVDRWLYGATGTWARRREG